jgi:hypothetical protein
MTPTIYLERMLLGLRRQGGAIVTDLFLDIATAFRLGYAHGERHGHASAREVLTEHPHWSAVLVGTYLNGVDDGVARDRWRLNGGREVQS